MFGIMYRMYEYCEGHGRPRAVNAAEQGIEIAVEDGMRVKAAEFVKTGSDIYRKT